MEKLYKIILRNKQTINITEDRFKTICNVCFKGEDRFVLIDDFLINLVDIVCIAPFEKTITCSEQEQFIINKHLKKPLCLE